MTEEGLLPTKMCIFVIADSDAPELIDRLIESKLPVTKLGSTGGFLARGNMTIFSGVDDSQFDLAMKIVSEVCQVRKEFIPIQTLPIFGDGGFVADPVEVRVGGAVVFVLDIERFDRF